MTNWRIIYYFIKLNVTLIYNMHFWFTKNLVSIVNFTFFPENAEMLEKFNIFIFPF